MSPAAAISGALWSTATVVLVDVDVVRGVGESGSFAHAASVSSSARAATRLFSSVGERFGERGVHEEGLDDVRDLQVGSHGERQH
ncbi:MAG: hypothetical protein QOG90_2405 [Actinomycetota bacterium]